MLRDWNRSRGSDSKMEQFQDWGVMAEAAGDLWSYLSLRQKQDEAVSMKKLKGIEHDTINQRENNHVVGIHVSIVSVLSPRVTVWSSLSLENA